MKKIKVSMTDITKNWRKVFRCGYCDLHNIMYTNDPQYYNCGVYGWNCDIYVDYKRDIAITTGYRNMRGECIPHEIWEKYNNIAKEILNAYYTMPYDEKKKALEENMENFLDELNKL